MTARRAHRRRAPAARQAMLLLSGMPRRAPIGLPAPGNPIATGGSRAEAGLVAVRVAGLLAGLVAGLGCADHTTSLTFPTPTTDAATGFDAAPGLDGGGADARAPQHYSIVVLPDTQYYASKWHDVFTAQTRWVLDNRDAERIAFVLHTGDIVDGDTPDQWSVAAGALHLLDNQVPYVVTAGNHDYGTFADRMGMGNMYFPAAQLAELPGFVDTFEPDHVENSFSVFTVPGGGRWLVIALEFGPRDEVLAWADRVLKLLHEVPAIVITHAYLYHDGTRYDHVGSPAQSFNPHAYLMAGQPGTTINDGEEIWTKLVAPNSNVKLVFSGHDVSGVGIPPGTTARLTSTRADGTRVHQILANYQTCTSPSCDEVHGGNGFLRIIRFFPETRSLSVSTYSPYLDQSLTDPGNAFALDLTD
jgi:hypothetical protein